jgi:hypothetical protein
MSSRSGGSGRPPADDGAAVYLIDRESPGAQRWGVTPPHPPKTGGGKEWLEELGLDTFRVVKGGPLPRACLPKPALCRLCRPSTAGVEHCGAGSHPTGASEWGGLRLDVLVLHIQM